VVARGAATGWSVTGVVRSPQAARVVAAAGGLPVDVGTDGSAALARAIEGARAVVHLAQIGAERGGRTYETVNVGLTDQVIEAARASGVSRVVYFSGLGVAHYGMTRRCTNPYFLSKLSAELRLFRSGLESRVFRPSYIVGPGDSFVPTVLAALAGGEVELPGDGEYRMQPIAVSDVADLVLAAAGSPSGSFPTVFDLVGPEPIAYARLLERLAAAAARAGHPSALRVREIPVAEADRRAREGGYQGMLPDELDCLLCDEVSHPGPLVALLGRNLEPLDAALDTAVRARR